MSSSLFGHCQNMGNLLLLLPLFIIPLYIITKHVLRKAQNLPPTVFPNLPILGHLYLLKSPLYRALAKVSARCGPILLLQFGSRRVFLVSSPSAAEECFTKNDVTFANRPRLLAGKHLGYNYSTLVWANYGDHWRNLRRIASTEILSASRLQTLQSIRIDEVRLLVRKLFTASTETVEMKSVFFELMLNVMMRMISGKTFYGENVAEVEEAARFREIMKESFRIGETTNIGDYLPMIGARDLEKRLVSLQEKRDGFMQGLLDEQRAKMAIGTETEMEEETINSSKKKQTLIAGLLMMQNKQPEYYTDDIIRGLMLILIAAGTDTSVGTMEWALSLLLNNPGCLEKAQAEIDDIVGQDRLFDESDIAKLPYLHCIMNETMRMYPAGPLIPHESSEDCTVGGYLVPRNTMLLVNVWAIQNDPKIWADPQEFRPERFEGLAGSRDGFKLMPFGFGRRSCPGEGLATRMIGLVLGSLIQCFEWERESKEMVDMAEGVGLTMPKEKPLVAKCRPRLIMMKLLSQI